ncbi:MAG: patatin-like phospholipase family protein, partial [Sphingomonadales bacterium]
MADMDPRRSAPGLPLPDTVALVLQGGGALGSYQAGVIEALGEARIGVDWVAGISIGAVNAALFAGNPPERRIEAIRTFWDTAASALPSFPIWPLDAAREAVHE